MITADMSDLLCFYEGKGWALVPARRGEKRPCIENWPHRQFEIGDIDLDGNVGVKLGRRSGNLVDIDLDAVETIELAPLIHAADRRNFRAEIKAKQPSALHRGRSGIRGVHRPDQRRYAPRAA
jgi:hypothetical protein